MFYNCTLMDLKLDLFKKTQARTDKITGRVSLWRAHAS